MSKHSLIRRAALASLLCCTSARAQPQSPVRVTYYPVFGPMYYSGTWTYTGAAACGDAYPAFAHLTIHAAWDVTVECDDWSPYLGYRQVDVYALARPLWLSDDYYEVEIDGEP